jgi:hypothetical protein
VTTQGGFAAFESVDGKRLFYSRHAGGIFSVPVDGGPEEKLTTLPQCWGYWTVARQGLYLLDETRAGPTLEFFRFDTRQLSHVRSLPDSPACGESGLSLSPDEGRLAYVAATRGSDVMLIDHFH